MLRLITRLFNQKNDSEFYLLDLLMRILYIRKKNKYGKYLSKNFEMYLAVREFEILSKRKNLIKKEYFRGQRPFFNRTYFSV